MVRRDVVRWAYRMILGREPENDRALDYHTKLADWKDLRARFLASEEFRREIALIDLSSFWVKCDIAPALSMWVDLADRFVSRQCLRGDFEPAETAFVLNHALPGGHFIDVGANVGWFSLLFAQKAGPTSRVACFEPNGKIFSYLKRSVDEAGYSAQVACFETALGSMSGEGFLSIDAGSGNPGNGIVAHDPVPGRSCQVVPIAPLDSFNIQSASVIKLDVEGGEFEVVNGALETIRRCRPVILSELYPELLEMVSRVTPRIFIERLQDLGYQTVLVDNERGGETLTDFPTRWGREIASVAFIPR